MNTKQLRRKILDLAIRGKLVPQDPNDESASVLLERIREEKERLIKEGKIKRDKKASATLRDDDKSHYGNLPQGWVWVTLSNITTVISDGDHQPPPQSDSGVPFLVISDVRSGSIVFDKARYVSQNYYDGLAWTRKPYKGDVLFTVTGSYGIPIMVEMETPFCFQRHIALLRPCVVENHFLSLFLLSDLIKQQCDEFATGIAQKTVGLESLRKIMLPLPPLAEQQRIVTAIESAFSVIDEIERNKTDLQSAITAAKSKILSLAIRGKLVPQDPNDEPASVLLERIRSEREQLIKSGKIKRGKGESAAINCDDNSHYEQLPFDLPKSWQWYHLSDLWELLSGRDLTPSEYADNEIGIPYITGASNFTDGDLIINRWTACPRVIAKNDDLLITCKGTVGAMLINTQGDIHIARQIMAIRNRSGLNVRFLQIVMTSFILQITTAAKGIIPGISREDLLNMLIPCPPLNEQTRIEKIVNNAFIVLNEIAENLN